jgi:hypothetical protein
MKKNIINTAIFFAATILLIMTMNSCDKGYNDASFGYNYIYMPQATVSGGLNLNYLVPAGLDSATFNYQVDTINHKINVYLGVSASGEQANAGFTVNVSANNDTTNQIINGGTIANAVLLADSMYTLPSTVTVPAGKHSASFLLSIDSKALEAYAGKTVLLTVQLSNPTKYILNTTLDKTVVEINVHANPYQGSWTISSFTFDWNDGDGWGNSGEAAVADELPNSAPGLDDIITFGGFSGINPTGTYNRTAGADGKFASYVYSYSNTGTDWNGKFGELPAGSGTYVINSDNSVTITIEGNTYNSIGCSTTDGTTMTYLLNPAPFSPGSIDWNDYFGDNTNKFCVATKIWYVLKKQ